jgi:glycerol uptake facilitator protein
LGDLSGTGILLSEFIGTALLLLLGIGVGANITLSRSFGHGRDWLLISLGWGFAVVVGASVAWRSGAQLNPAVTRALAMTGSVPWDQVPWFFLAQVLGAMAGAMLAYLTYERQFDTHDDPAGTGGVFFTSASVRDFGPRLVYALLPIRGKGSAQWGYAWVPIVGPLLGGAVGAVLFNAVGG